MYIEALTPLFMNTDSIIRLHDPNPSGERQDNIHQKKTAEKFEELFARHLVREMTKHSFKMVDNEMGTATGNSLYREFVTDALASKLASQRQLGLADMLEQHWQKNQESAFDTVSGSNTHGIVDTGEPENNGAGVFELGTREHPSSRE